MNYKETEEYVHELLSKHKYDLEKIEEQKTAVEKIIRYNLKNRHQYPYGDIMLNLFWQRRYLKIAIKLLNGNTR